MGWLWLGFMGPPGWAALVPWMLCHHAWTDDQSGPFGVGCPLPGGKLIDVQNLEFRGTMDRGLYSDDYYGSLYLTEGDQCWMCMHANGVYKFVSDALDYETSIYGQDQTRYNQSMELLFQIGRTKFIDAATSVDLCSVLLLWL